MRRLFVLGILISGVTLQEFQPAVSAAQSTSAKASSSAVVLKQDMRKLWTEHVVWTREYIVAAVGDQPDAQAAAGRLMKNQEDIGAAVAAYYGKPVTAGEILSGKVPPTAGTRNLLAALSKY